MPSGFSWMFLRSEISPAFRRSGRGFVGRGLVAVGVSALLSASILLFTAGCVPGGGKTHVCEHLGYDAERDSLGLDEFLALDPAEQRLRRDLAAAWTNQARRVSAMDARVHAWHNVAGLTPDDPFAWLELAGIWRWLGDYVGTVAYLENAAAAVRLLDDVAATDPADDGERHWESARRTALLRGWLHYDRGEWHEGLRWIRAVLRRAPGDASLLQIRGLLAGANQDRSLAHRSADELERKDVFDTRVPWIRSALDRSQGLHSEAYNFLAGLRPFRDHAAECWRDMGESAELVGEWSNMRRFYRESFHALPFRDKSCLYRTSGPRLAGERRAEFWLAQGRYYVTGSLSAYTRMAWERYDGSAAASDRDFWAGQAVNAAGILIRRKLDLAWAHRVRGLVFFATEQASRSLQDLRKAEKLLDEQQISDPRVEAALGRLLLKQEKYARALPHLRDAISLDDSNAAAWGDLGLCLIMNGDPPAAARALDRAVELDPSAVAAWYNRGLMHLRAGDFGEAVAALQEAARLAPGNREVLDLLQRAHRLQSP